MKTSQRTKKTKWKQTNENRLRGSVKGLGNYYTSAIVVAVEFFSQMNTHLQSFETDF